MKKEQLKDCRKWLGCTQVQLAEKLGLEGSGMIKKMESGDKPVSKRTTKQVHDLMLIAKVRNTVKTPAILRILNDILGE